MERKWKERYKQKFRRRAVARMNACDNGLASADAAKRVIDLAEQNPAPRFAPVGPDAEEILRVVRKQSDDQQDALRFQIVGLK